MSKFYTFSHEDKVSASAHEHATLRFMEGYGNDTNEVAVRSKKVLEGARMRDEYETVGQFGSNNGTKWVAFNSQCYAFDMVSTELTRRGYHVFMIDTKGKPWSYVRSATHWGRITIHISNGRVTNPDTISGADPSRRDRQADANSLRRKELGNRLMAWGSTRNWLNS